MELRSQVVYKLQFEYASVQMGQFKNFLSSDAPVHISH